MSEHKHTPEPWEVERQEYPHDRDVSFEINAPGPEGTSRNICCTIMRDKEAERETIEEDEANAHLMGAAPNMLKALEAFKQAFDQEWGDDYIRSGFAPMMMLRSAIDKAKVAIAKAKGEATP